MTGDAPQTFYRVVRANAPSEEDFKSNHAKGKKRRRYEGEDE